MRRSEINQAVRDAMNCFARHDWALPPRPAWDVTDFGLGDFDRFGLVLVNLAEEPEYCEKLMYARAGQVTPCHTHARKKEDIICRAGRLAVRVWPARPRELTEPMGEFRVQVDREWHIAQPGRPLELRAGSRVTLTPGLWHEFAPLTDECIIGEVSTANDDSHDNFFVDDRIGRFPGVLEDEAPLVRLLSDAR